MDIRQVTPEQAHDIIETRTPRGLFYTMEKDLKTGKMGYVGLDNLDGDCWTEDFDSLPECLEWVQG